jgi:hypothetical protein
LTPSSPDMSIDMYNIFWILQVQDATSGKTCRQPGSTSCEVPW